MAIQYFGIRHHGPGSAKNLVKALSELKPDILLIEGPPEAEHLLQWINNSEMKPPVAILAYVPESPQKAVFYPYAEFSPEWQAIKFGLNNKIPIRFIDLPLVHKFAIEEEVNTIDQLEVQDKEDLYQLEENGFLQLAKLSGLESSEEWWDQFIERNMEGDTELFIQISDTIKELREGVQISKEEERREAFMRLHIKKAENELYENIAVITGAWHTPALMENGNLKKDQELTKKLPKTKIECTWIPWSNSRLMFESGYGAGIQSPGWYNHQWNHPEDNGILWLVKSAQLFRNNHKDISSAHVIESVRLANTLAVLRNLKKPGLQEFNESIQSVMCMGDSEPLLLIKKEQIIGTELGAIPANSPQSPLQQDFEKQVKSFRLKLSELPNNITLDLRNENDLNKSIFLHRLSLLGVSWANKGWIEGKGTFKETWTLCWKPESMIELITHSARGNSIESTAFNFLNEKVNELKHLDELVILLEAAIPADLQHGVNSILMRIDEVSASTSDSTLLLKAIIPLTNVIRYGHVRNYEKTDMIRIFSMLYYRLSIGLPLSCSGIDEQSAQFISQQIESLYGVLRLLDIQEFLEDWKNCLLKIFEMENCAPFVAGTLTRILKDSNIINDEVLFNSMSKALTFNINVIYSSQWIEGFLNQSASILIHDDSIWQITSDWVSSLSDEDFNDILPLLRRTFSTFTSSENQKIAERVIYSGSPVQKQNYKESWDMDRAEMVIPVLKNLFGI